MEANLKTYVIKALRCVRGSFSAQLTLGVAGFVVAISAVVMAMLMRFSQEVIRDETLTATRQALENAALRIDNTLRQAELSARLEQRTLTVDKALIEQLLAKYDDAVTQQLPHARLYVDTLRAALPRRHEKRVESVAPADASPAPDAETSTYKVQCPTYNGQYAVVIDIPAGDIDGRYAGIRQTQLLIGIGAVLVLLFICWKIIAWHLRPLHLLADTAQRIGGGHLDEPVPNSGHKDEIGQLQNSLSQMQQSLSGFMDEMRHKQATLSRQNETLQKAYEEVQAYDNLKARFVREMTSRMASPVTTVCSLTDTLCHNYAELTDDQMATIQADILSATEAITDLLDQLLNTPVAQDTPLPTSLHPSPYTPHQDQKPHD